VLRAVTWPRPDHNTVLMCATLKDKHNSNPTVTLTVILTLKQRDPDYHQNPVVSSLAHMPPFHRTLWKLVE